jgi:RNA polymerase sigma factor (sigma-70 family)
MHDDDVHDEVLEDAAEVVLDDDGQGDVVLSETADNEIEDDDVTPDDIDDREPADDGPAVDALGYFLRQLNKPQNSLLSADAFHALAVRFAAQKSKVARLIEDIICCRVFDIGHDPSVCPNCVRYDEFANEFGAPDALANLSVWADELIHSHELFLPRLFRFFGLREAEKILDDICRANLRLVLSIAKRSYWRWKGVPLIELVQEGNQGLILAAIRFNPELGFRFSTFASWRIRQYVMRQPHDFGRTIRIPIHASEFYSRFCRLSADHGFDPKKMNDDAMSVVAKEMGTTVHGINRVLAILTKSQGVISLDGDSRLFDDGAIAPLINRIADQTISAPDRLLEEKESGKLLSRAVQRALNENERFVIEHYFGLGGLEESALKDIAALIGVSGERVRQIKTKALKKMHEALRNKQIGC